MFGSNRSGNPSSSALSLAGSIVVVAKCPIPGESKTRLIPLTGLLGSAALASAMLADVLGCLTAIHSSDDGRRQLLDRILLYAPPTRYGREQMAALLDRYTIPRQHEDDDDEDDNNDDTEDEITSNNEYYGISNSSKIPPIRQGLTDAFARYNDRLCHSTKTTTSSTKKVTVRNKKKAGKPQWNPQAWTLVPMSTERRDSKQSSSSWSMNSVCLSDILTNALHHAHARQEEIATRARAPVIFVGMDAPEIPIDEILYAFKQSDEARICPAADGGYGLLSIPSKANADKVFQGVRWSDPLTALSQIKALTDQNIPVKLGRLMYDIDEPDDIVQLVERLQQLDGKEHADADDEDTKDDVLFRGPPLEQVSTRRTKRMLDEKTSLIRIKTTGSSCPQTREALENLQLWSNLDHRKPKNKNTLMIRTASTDSSD